ncbi:MAG: hypothetical protein HN948_04555 [Clostridia bacterium]|jgi:uncharacterized protein|nr:hypothetical protein [Clostridia bacterium]MBT7122261.1 hypothetical protein [Clostridia bacterium]
MDEKNLRQFCSPHYESKDIMHNLCHIDRIIRLAKKMCENHADAEIETVIFGAYFHGLVDNSTDDIQEYLSSINIVQSKIAKILQASRDSQINSIPISLEGSILHDAHLLEGGKTFIVTKCLVTGTARGQSLTETIAYMEKNIIGNGKVSLEENAATLDERQLYAKEFIRELKNGLNL